MKFTVKDIKEKFIKLQVSTNWHHVSKRIQEEKSLADTFHDFSQVEGFHLSSIDSGDSFDFTAFLHGDHNLEDNRGEVVFKKEDFIDAFEELKKQEEQQALTSKPVSVKKTVK